MKKKIIKKISILSLATFLSLPIIISSCTSMKPNLQKNDFLVKYIESLKGLYNEVNAKDYDHKKIAFHFLDDKDTSEFVEIIDDVFAKNNTNLQDYDVFYNTNDFYTKNQNQESFYVDVENKDFIDSARYKNIYRKNYYKYQNYLNLPYVEFLEDSSYDNYEPNKDDLDFYKNTMNLVDTLYSDNKTINLFVNSNNNMLPKISYSNAKELIEIYKDIKKLNSEIEKGIYDVSFVSKEDYLKNNKQTYKFDIWKLFYDWYYDVVDADFTKMYFLKRIVYLLSSLIEIINIEKSTKKINLLKNHLFQIIKNNKVIINYLLSALSRRELYRIKNKDQYQSLQLNQYTNTKEDLYDYLTNIDSIKNDFKNIFDLNHNNGVYDPNLSLNYIVNNSVDNLETNIRFAEVNRHWSKHEWTTFLGINWNDSRIKNKNDFANHYSSINFQRPLNYARVDDELLKLSYKQKLIDELNLDQLYNGSKNEVQSKINNLTYLKYKLKDDFITKDFNVSFWSNHTKSSYEYENIDNKKEDQIYLRKEFVAYNDITSINNLFLNFLNIIKYLDDNNLLLKVDKNNINNYIWKLKI